MIIRNECFEVTWIHFLLPNAQAQPHGCLARSVLLGAQSVTSNRVGCSAWLAYLIFGVYTNTEPLGSEYGSEISGFGRVGSFDFRILIFRSKGQVSKSHADEINGSA